MYKIGEFAKIGNVSVRMLRHYDNIGLIKPEIIDKETGYRYYSIKQLPLLNRVVFFKELGFSLEEVKKMSNSKINLNEMQEIVYNKKLKLEEDIKEAYYKLHQVTIRLEQIENEGKPPKYDVNVKESEAFHIASLETIVPHTRDMGEYCKKMYEELYKELYRFNITDAEEEVTFYHNKEYSENNIQMEAGIKLTEKHIDMLKGKKSNISVKQIKEEKKTASLIYRGDFGGMSSAILSLLGWIGANNFLISGALREVHLSGKAHTNQSEDNDAVVELQIPIK